MKRKALLAALGCAACAGYAVEPPRDSGRFAQPCGQRDPLGTAAELRTPVGANEGVWIDAPEYCNVGHGWEGGAFIRVHGRGFRKFVRFRGCKSEPRTQDECPEIDLDAFMLVVSGAVGDIGPMAGGAGLGVCSDALVPPSQWRGRVEFSTSVTRWQDADAAIQIVYGLLEAWKIGDSHGVSVRGFECAVEE